MKSTGYDLCRQWMHVIFCLSSIKRGAHVNRLALWPVERMVHCFYDVSRVNRDRTFMAALMRQLLMDDLLRNKRGPLRIHGPWFLSDRLRNE